MGSHLDAFCRVIWVLVSPPVVYRGRVQSVPQQIQHPRDDERSIWAWSSLRDGLLVVDICLCLLLLLLPGPCRPRDVSWHFDDHGLVPLIKARNEGVLGAGCPPEGYQSRSWFAELGRPDCPHLSVLCVDGHVDDLSQPLRVQLPDSLREVRRAVRVCLVVAGEGPLGSVGAYDEVEAELRRLGADEPDQVILWAQGDPVIVLEYRDDHSVGVLDEVFDCRERLSRKWRTVEVEVWFARLSVRDDLEEVPPVPSECPEVSDGVVPCWVACKVSPPAVWVLQLQEALVSRCRRRCGALHAVFGAHPEIPLGVEDGQGCGRSHSIVCVGVG